jgi:hypothetical protein
MMAVVKDRPKLKSLVPQLLDIRRLAESCAKQLTAWTLSIEASPIQGKRHMTARLRQTTQVAKAAHEFRLNFLRNLKPEHPLFKSREARVARGEESE